MIIDKKDFLTVLGEWNEAYCIAEGLCADIDGESWDYEPIKKIMDKYGIRTWHVTEVMREWYDLQEYYIL